MNRIAAIDTVPDDLTKAERVLLANLRAVAYGEIQVMKQDGKIVNVRVSRTIDPKEFRE